MTKEERRKDWLMQVNALAMIIEKLTYWETDFVGSIDKVLNNNVDLSFRQSLTLRKIYHRRTG